MLFLFVACDPSPSLPQQGELHLLTYNIHGLPELVTGDDTPERIRQLSPMLNDYALVGLQEDWDASNHNIVLDNTEHPYSDYFDDTVDSNRVYGSGLTMLSMVPLLSVTQNHYEQCHGLLDGAADCFASKGFQRAEISLNEEQSLFVYNTHLEAGSGDEDNLARDSQIDQLLASMASLSPESPFVLMGDLNLRPTDPEDVPLLDKLHASGLLDSCQETECSEANHIDRILFRSSSTVDLYARHWSRETQFVDNDGVDLSDHPAVSATISWGIVD